MWYCVVSNLYQTTEHHIPEDSNLHIHKLFHFSLPVLGCNIIMSLLQKSRKNISWFTSLNRSFSKSAWNNEASLFYVIKDLSVKLTASCLITVFSKTHLVSPLHCYRLLHLCLDKDWPKYRQVLHLNANLPNCKDKINTLHKSCDNFHNLSTVHYSAGTTIFLCSFCWHVIISVYFYAQKFFQFKFPKLLLHSCYTLIFKNPVYEPVNHRQFHYGTEQMLMCS